MSEPRISSPAPTARAAASRFLSPRTLHGATGCWGSGNWGSGGWVPSWLVSGILHLLALNLLAWFGFQYGKPGQDAAVVVAFATDEANLHDDLAADLASAIEVAPRATPPSATATEAETAFTTSDPDAGPGITLGSLEPLDEVPADSSAKSAGGSPARWPSNAIAMATVPVASFGPVAAPAGKQAEFFGVSATGSTFVFIVDCSRSMIGPRFEAAKRELLYAVRRLSPTQRFYVIFFDGMTKPMRINGEIPHNAAPVLATHANLDQLEAWVHSVPNGPWTNPSGAVELALDLRPDAIYLLSDGDFTDHGATRKTLSRRNLDEQRRPRVAVHTIGLHSRDGEATLRALAKTHGGEYRFVPAE
ncbi:MAG: VWA domain-containing protein [Pirellulales bacterium]